MSNEPQGGQRVEEAGQTDQKYKATEAQHKSVLPNDVWKFLGAPYKRLN